MFKDKNFATANLKDFRKAMYIIGNNKSPLLTLFLANGQTTKATDTTITRKIDSYDGITINTGSGEGADWKEDGNITTTYVTNYTERFDTVIKVSNTAKAVAQANGTNIMAKETQARITRLKNKIDYTLINGKTSTLEDGQDGHTMNGLLELGTKNTYTTNFTKANFDSAILHLYNYGYTENVYLAINPADKANIEKILKEGLTLNVENGQSRIGFPIFSYITNLGIVINIIMDTNINAGTFMFFSLNGIEVPILIPVTPYKIGSDKGSYTGTAVETELTVIATPYNVVTFTKGE